MHAVIYINNCINFFVIHGSPIQVLHVQITWHIAAPPPFGINKPTPYQLLVSQSLQCRVDPLKCISNII